MKYLFTLILFLLIISCEKDSLDGNKSYLEGKWQWIHSKRYYQNSSGTLLIEYVESSNFDDYYYVEFKHKGCVNYFKNDKSEKSFRIVFDLFDVAPNDGNEPFNSYDYLIKLNNKETKKIQGRVNLDTLSHSSFDYSNLPVIKGEGDYGLLHFYKKVN